MIIIICGQWAPSFDTQTYIYKHWHIIISDNDNKDKYTTK